MKLLTKEMLEKLPALYSLEEQPTEEKVAQVKFFTPWSNWTWYATEGSPCCLQHGNYDCEDPTCLAEKDRWEMMFFGLVFGLEQEWGYFSLAELESIKGPFGLAIERDRYFDPKPICEVDGYED